MIFSIACRIFIRVLWIRTKELMVMEQYGIWSLLPVALITALTIGTGEILYGILLCLVFLCRFVFAPKADDAQGLYGNHYGRV